jgi:polysaccharide pyruvyl transferase WcaK-like protein
MAWARDHESYELLAALAGDEHDPERHRLGVDMAFLLERHEPDLAATTLRRWLDERDRPLVGVNVSGLLYNQADSGNRFGLSFHYPTVMRRLVTRLLQESDARIVLVDHVLARRARDVGEVDAVASSDLVARIDERHRSRVTHVPPGLDACETKWIIAQTDWFCGARMHATIGALSSGVPAAAIGYSMKTRAVFETCGLEAEVTDVSGLDEAAVVEQLWESWTRHDQVRATLAGRLPYVLTTAHRQMDDIAAAIFAADESGRCLA